MNKLTVTLKQHTPLIHFQHNQEGATLRASEVKPKLDKYLIKHVFGDNFEKCKHFLVGYTPNNERILSEKFKSGFRALDYKLRISADDISKKEYMIVSLLNSKGRDKLQSEYNINVLDNTPYFAQEQLTKDILEDPLIWDNGINPTGKIKEFKKGLIWDHICLSFFSLNSFKQGNQRLIEIIKDQIEQFFLMTNFGTRSTKGFGSFTVSRIDKQDVIWNDKEMSLLPCGFVYKKNTSNNKLGVIFKEIKEDYQKLKSGVNYNGYTKSLLFCYAVDKMIDNPRWEKRYFKQQLQPSQGTEKPLGYFKLKANNAPVADSSGYSTWNNNYNYQYLRALLGLAEQYEFQLQDSNDKVVVKVQSDDIYRYASPLLFKVINGITYIIGDEINENILNQRFHFSYFLGQQVISSGGRSLIGTLKTPSEFILSDFMEYAMSKSESHGQNLNYSKLK